MKNKNYKNKILKFLSEKMSSKEREKFLSELNSSEKLNLEFQKINFKLNNFISNTKIELETDYWDIIPSNLSSLKSNVKRKTLSQKLAFVIPIIIFILIFFVVKDSYSPTILTNETELSILINSLDNNSFNDFYNNNLLYDEIVGRKLINDQIAETYINNIELLNENELNYPDDDFNYLEQIEESELEILYQNLLEEKIL
ncbi:MAG: hypothetical protein JW866_06035 [Ignavibacteriales bacterium]|nr:hypothetical protein [Ignavibacteriales bacterium]